MSFIRTASLENGYPVLQLDIILPFTMSNERYVEPAGAQRLRKCDKDPFNTAGLLRHRFIGKHVVTFQTDEAQIEAPAHER